MLDVMCKVKAQGVGGWLGFIFHVLKVRITGLKFGNRGSG